MNDQFLSQEVIFEMVQLPFYLVLYLKKDYSVFVLLEKTFKTINHPNFSVRLAPAVFLRYQVRLLSKRAAHVTKFIKIQTGGTTPKLSETFKQLLKTSKQNENNTKIQRIDKLIRLKLIEIMVSENLLASQFFYQLIVIVCNV